MKEEKPKQPSLLEEEGGTDQERELIKVRKELNVARVEIVRLGDKTRICSIVSVILIVSLLVVVSFAAHILILLVQREMKSIPCKQPATTRPLPPPPTRTKTIFEETRHSFILVPKEKITPFPTMEQVKDKGFLGAAIMILQSYLPFSEIRISSHFISYTTVRLGSATIVSLITFVITLGCLRMIK